MIASAAEAETEARQPGRPRSTAVDRAILDATLERLAIDGYQDLTLAGVAETAGVGRPAIYRRYESKADLAAEALLHASAESEMTLPGDTRAALRALLGATARALGRPGAMTILGSLLAQEAREPELMAVFRETVLEPRHAIVRSVLEAGVRRGEVRRDVDYEVAIDLLFGALLSRALDGRPVDDPWLDRIVDVVWSVVDTHGSGPDAYPIVVTGGWPSGR